ncbi:MAG: rod shape-determining protein RodA [Lachnospira sp.]|nr:rod shape-determining protein RodA [Lachnospira sp.]
MIIKKLKSYNYRQYNYKLVLLLMIITIFGIVVIDSAGSSAGFEKKQLVGFIISLVMMLIISLFDYKFILKFYWLIYLFNIGLLLLVEFAGKNVNGATRWYEFNIGSFSIQFQPTEFAKLFLILFFAKFLSRFKDYINKWLFLGVVAFLSAIPLFLIVMQPDLSSTILITAIICTIIYMAGISYKKIAIIVTIVVLAVLSIFLYIKINPDQKIIKTYQIERVLAFLYPDQYEDKAYQQENSVLAIGSGKLDGKGLNNDDTQSVKNAGFLPEPQTDFIFAVIGEELGFKGTCLTLALLALIIIEVIVTAIKAADFQGRLIATGIAAQLIFQVFINIGVTTALLPNTGIPLPFVSYGLSSLVAVYAEMGILININLQTKSRER